jgi:hypothetical protein
MNISISDLFHRLGPLFRRRRDSSDRWIWWLAYRKEWILLFWSWWSSRLEATTTFELQSDSRRALQPIVNFASYRCGNDKILNMRPWAGLPASQSRVVPAWWVFHWWPRWRGWPAGWRWWWSRLNERVFTVGKVGELAEQVQRHEGQNVRRCALHLVTRKGVVGPVADYPPFFGFLTVLGSVHLNTKNNITVSLWSACDKGWLCEGGVAVALRVDIIILWARTGRSVSRRKTSRPRPRSWSRPGSCSSANPWGCPIFAR